MGLGGYQEGFGGQSGEGGISRGMGGNQEGSQEGCGGKIGGDGENRKTQDF